MHEGKAFVFTITFLFCAGNFPVATIQAGTLTGGIR